MLVTVELPDGSFIRKPFESLEPDDLVVFDGEEPLKYAPPELLQDFDD